MANKRLIDAYALIEDIEKRYCKPCKAEGKDYNEVACRACWVDDMILEIDPAPTVDAVEVVHGEWEMGLDEGDYEYGTCSVCGYNEYNAFGCLLPHNYCPNCGAKMDGGNEDG